MWINDDRYTVYTDKPLIPFGGTIYSSDFSIVESKFNDAPPNGRWLNVDDVILVEGKLVNSKSKLEISCKEIIRNTPEGRCMDAHAKACEEARKSLAPLPSDSSTQSSGMSHQAEIAEKRNDFIAVGSDDSLYQETDHRRKQIGSIGYKFDKYFYNGWFKGEVMDIVDGKNGKLCQVSTTKMGMWSISHFKL